MRKEGLSYDETARQFEVNSHSRIQEWERIYLIYGPEGFRTERRGRGSKGRPPELDKQIDYLDYYNNRRSKAKLKGLPPALHRLQALSAA